MAYTSAIRSGRPSRPSSANSVLGGWNRTHSSTILPTAPKKLPAPTKPLQGLPNGHHLRSTHPAHPGSTATFVYPELCAKQPAGSLRYGPEPPLQNTAGGCGGSELFGVGDGGGAIGGVLIRGGKLFMGFQ